MEPGECTCGHLRSEHGFSVGRVGCFHTEEGRLTCDCPVYEHWEARFT